MSLGAVIAFICFLSDPAVIKSGYWSITITAVEICIWSDVDEHREEANVGFGLSTVKENALQNKERDGVTVV